MCITSGRASLFPICSTIFLFIHTFQFFFPLKMANCMCVGLNIDGASIVQSAYTYCPFGTDNLKGFSSAWKKFIILLNNNNENKKQCSFFRLMFWCAVMYLQSYLCQSPGKLFVFLLLDMPCLLKKTVAPHSRQAVMITYETAENNHNTGLK